MKIINFFIYVIFFTSSAFASDIIILKEGLTYSGKVLRIKKCEVLFEVENERYLIPSGDISKILFEDQNNPIFNGFLKNQSKIDDKCLKGQLDAMSLHGKEAGHFALGFLFGGLSMVGTLIANPTPNKGKNTYLMSQNTELFDDPVYISCYKRKARGKLIKWEAIGWSSWIIIALSAI